MYRRSVSTISLTSTGRTADAQAGNRGEIGVRNPVVPLGNGRGKRIEELVMVVVNVSSVMWCSGRSQVFKRRWMYSKEKVLVVSSIVRTAPGKVVAAKSTGHPAPR